MDDDIEFYVDVPGSVIKNTYSHVKKSVNLCKISQKFCLPHQIFVNVINQWLKQVIGWG